MEWLQRIINGICAMLIAHNLVNATQCSCSLFSGANIQDMVSKVCPPIFQSYCTISHPCRVLAVSECKYVKNCSRVEPK